MTWISTGVCQSAVPWAPTVPTNRHRTRALNVDPVLLGANRLITNVKVCAGVDYVYCSHLR